MQYPLRSVSCLLIACFVLAITLLPVAAAVPRDRSDAFIGYREERCIDDMGSEVCAAYKDAGMCATGYIRDSCKKACSAC